MLMVLQCRQKRSWSFSGLATVIRITMMYYVDLYSLLNHPEKDWESILEQPQESLPWPSLFD